jgi:hypothetical protein
LAILLGSVATLAYFGNAPSRPHYAITNDRPNNNWAGYHIETSSGSVSDVKGSWKVPVVSCPSTANSLQEASFWIGIDGAGSSRTLEQTGIAAGCAVQNGTPSEFYYAWYEWVMPPNIQPNQIIKKTVTPGDLIVAEVSWDTRNNQFTASISDQTQQWSESHVNATIAASAQRSTAEWIAEASSLESGVQPLPDFKTVTFSNCFATVGGVSGQMGSFSLIQDTMTSNSGTGIKAEPVVPMWNDGTSFQVLWISSGS